jgi:hypothetical protein
MSSMPLPPLNSMEDSYVNERRIVWKAAGNTAAL